MIGIWKSYADIYLIVAGIAMLTAFGLPLVIAPMRWAHLFQWDVSQRGNLTLFLARSMGVFISIMALYAFRVSQSAAAMPFYFELMLWVFAGMLLLHVYGAIRKTQPVTETFEIGVWIALIFITILFYPG